MKFEYGTRYWEPEIVRFDNKPTLATSPFFTSKAVNEKNYSY